MCGVQERDRRGHRNGGFRTARQCNEGLGARQALKWGITCSPSSSIERITDLWGML